ncbi:MAG: putative DNA binding domain-containing protein [Clostridiales bacterium]|jgi:predicted HTH transcriptional regulator|nr:putative DNA binding domain-containing protein [Clostridiales bacterium]
MIDFNNLSQYRENNRLEAKKAVGGLPKNMWESYSAFANSDGGIILLGIEELKGGKLSVIGVPDADNQVKNIWSTLHDQCKISVNLLAERHISIESVDGKQIIVMTVPRADRREKPIYLDNNPLHAFRRNGDGDYHCTKEEVSAMMRDAYEKTQDSLVLEKMVLDVFDYGSVKSYRNVFRITRPKHVWESLSDVEFLQKLNAIGKGADGVLHPTAAGLLMFGYEYEILNEYGSYFLDYQEHHDAGTRWTDRIISSSGEWSGNLFDFYYKVANKLPQDIVKVPFKLAPDGFTRIDDTPVHKALREALANCLINADYYGSRGLVIIKARDKITFANPGGFRIALNEAVGGGISDPRNSVVHKMFNLIDVGERAGSGIPNIFSVWEQENWITPQYTETRNPDRTILSLSFKKSCDKVGTNATEIAINTDKVGINSAEVGITTAEIPVLSQTKQILEFIVTQKSASAKQISELLSVGQERARLLLTQLVTEGSLIAEGANKNRTYRLK